MANSLVTPNGRGLGMIPRYDMRTWVYPVAPLTAPPPSPIDLRRYMLPVRDQGSEGSCTGHAGTACLEGILQLADRPVNAPLAQLSPAFSYYNNRAMDGTPASQDAGASSLSIAKAFAKFGCCTEADMPYQAGAYRNRPSAAAYTKALAYRISHYYQVAGDLLGGVWAILSAGIPCCVGFQVPQSFETGVGSDGKVPQPGANDPILGGHEMCICGWFPDTGAPGGEGWVLCKNSWTAGFGLQGYVLMPTYYFRANLVMDITVLAYDSAPAPLPPPDPPTPPDPKPDPNDPRSLIVSARHLIQENLDYPEGVWLPNTLEEAAEYIDTALPLIPAPGPTPPDPPTPTPPKPTGKKTGFRVSYANHDPAVDAYIGDTPEQGEWGQHWGYRVPAPASGTVKAFTFPTPLSAMHGGGVDSEDMASIAQYYLDHAALFAGVGEPDSCYYKAGAQVMYFALLTFDTPQRLANGQMCKAIWLGHVKGDIAVGHVNAGDGWCTIWNSGINFEANGIPALASHAHTCGTATGALTMNGDVDGNLVAQLLGWELRDGGHAGPGPNEYMTGGYRAGKPLSAWGGHPLPPAPQ